MQDQDTTIAAPAHLGLCVSDLDLSLRFYCDGLGFQRAEGYDLDYGMLPGLAEALEVAAPVALRSQMIALGEMRVELLHYRQPSPDGNPSARRNQLGLTHLSFWVDDIDTTVARLVGGGGRVLPSTRRTLGVDLVFLSDPDGTRIELMQRT